MSSGIASKGLEVPGALNGLEDKLTGIYGVTTINAGHSVTVDLPTSLPLPCIRFSSLDKTIVLDEQNIAFLSDRIFLNGYNLVAAKKKNENLVLNQLHKSLAQGVFIVGYDDDTSGGTVETVFFRIKNSLFKMSWDVFLTRFWPLLTWYATETNSVELLHWITTRLQELVVSRDRFVDTQKREAEERRITQALQDENDALITLKEVYRKRILSAIARLVKASGQLAISLEVLEHAAEQGIFNSRNWLVSGATLQLPPQPRRIHLTNDVKAVSNIATIGSRDLVYLVEGSLPAGLFTTITLDENGNIEYGKKSGFHIIGVEKLNEGSIITITNTNLGTEIKISISIIEGTYSINTLPSEA